MKAHLYAIMALAILGLVDSLYLLGVHWGWGQAACLGIGECEVVNTSRYSEFLGLPVALLGAVTYLALLATSALMWWHLHEDLARRMQFLVAAIGVAFSAYLTYIEIFVLRVICPWCVISAIVITLITVLSARQLHNAATGKV